MDDWFGFSVSISGNGNTVAVGAPHPGFVTTRPGAAYVFTEPGAAWVNMTQTAKLTASDGAANDAFGESISIDGNTVVVGAIYATAGVSNQGAAYVFTEPGSAWVNMFQTSKLTASDGTTYAYFGCSVSIDGSTVVVGAYGAGVGGAAYTFTESGSVWTNPVQSAKLTASDGAAGAAFGFSVSIRGNTLVAGAQFATIGGNSDQGAAYFFGENPTITTVTASATTATFGTLVTISAKVTATLPSSVVPTGTVNFYDGNVELGQVPLNKSGTATFSSLSMAVGTHTLTAQYYADSSSNFLDSSSATVGPASTITTFAGSIAPNSIATDSQGNVYFSDSSDNSVAEVNVSTGAVTTVAGTGTRGYSGDGGAATAAQLNDPTGIAIDAMGNLFIADTGNNVVRKVDLVSGAITTIAGTGTSGYSGDGGPATAAELSDPIGVAIDNAGNILIVDANNYRVRKVDHLSGDISTFAGSGAFGAAGDGGPATQAQFEILQGLAVDDSGNVYILESSRVRKVDAITGDISTVAGTLLPGFSGDGGPATAAQIRAFGGRIAVDSSGNLFIGDADNQRVREVDSNTGIITTIAGNGTAALAGDGGQATASELDDPGPLAIDPAGNLFIADIVNDRIREILSASARVTIVPGPTATTTTLAATSAAVSYGQAVSLTATVAAPGGGTTPTGGTVAFMDGTTLLATVPLVAGTASYTAPLLAPGTHTLTANYSGNGSLFAGSASAVAPTTIINTVAGGGSGDGLAATSSSIEYPQGVVVDSAGDIFIADNDNNRIREVNHATGLISTIAGTGTSGYSGDGGPATAATLDEPEGLALDSQGDLFVADSSNNVIRKINLATGMISTVAGNGLSGFSGDGGPATAAELWDPVVVAVDSAGNLFIADFNNSRVRKVAASSGLISTFAGNGTRGFSGDTGPATAAELYYPRGVAVDSQGNVYIADTSNQRVREVNATTGAITTVAGTGTAGYSGDFGQATAAMLAYPESVAVDASGNLYIADYNNLRIRTVNQATKVITTLAGDGVEGYAGDGMAANNAELSYVNGIALDSAGNLYIADSGNNRIREVNAARGTIATVAGNGFSSYSGDGGAATAAQLDYATAVAIDAAGDLFIADTENNVVREVNAATGKISTIAGNGSNGYSGDGGAATAAELNRPYGVAVDAAGDVFIADSDNNVVREINHATRVISTVAGTGASGFAGDGGPATAAKLDYPQGIAVDAAGNLFIADSDNNVVREVERRHGQDFHDRRQRHLRLQRGRRRGHGRPAQLPKRCCRECRGKRVYRRYGQQRDSRGEPPYRRHLHGGRHGVPRVRRRWRARHPGRILLSPNGCLGFAGQPVCS